MLDFADLPLLVEPATLPDIDAAAVRAAGAAVRGYCGWHVAPEVEQTITLDGTGGPTLVLPSLLVKAITAQMGPQVAMDCHLLHGGIGYMQEYNLQFFTRRAKDASLRWGTTREMMGRVADALLVV